VSTTVVVPSISAVTDNGVTRFALRYSLENGDRSDLNSAFDYTDHELSTELDWQANVRNRVSLGWALSDGHSDPSSDNSEQQNEFERTNISFRYTFGADGARGRVILGVTQGDQEFTNNRTGVLSPTAGLDNEQLTTDLTFSVGLGGASRLVIQAINTESEFDNDTSRKREDLSLLAGLEWDVTDKTRGNIRLGRSKSDLVQGPQTNSSTWLINISWAPRQQTSFNLSTSRSANNSDDGIGSFTIATNTSASWSYQWTSRISSVLSFNTTENDFQGAGSRVDDVDTVSLSLSYALKRWLSMGLVFENSERESTINSGLNNFDREQARFVLNMSL